MRRDGEGSMNGFGVCFLDFEWSLSEIGFLAKAGQ